MLIDLKKKHTEKFKNMGVEFCVYRVTSYKERFKTENSQTASRTASSLTRAD
jgi:hypothetical protein